MVMEDKQSEQEYRRRALEALIDLAENSNSGNVLRKAAKVILMHTTPSKEEDAKE